MIAGSTNDVSNAVGQPGQAKPPVGITAFSRLRDKEKNPKLVFDVAYDMKPVMGIATEVIVAIVNQAKHPNAAKLMTRWMMGDEKGGQGYKPYFVLGNIPVRTDQPAPRAPEARADEHLDGRCGLCLGPWPGDPRFLAGEPEVTHDCSKHVHQPSQPQTEPAPGDPGAAPGRGPHGLVVVPFLQMVHDTAVWQEADSRISRAAGPGEWTIFHYLRVFSSRLSVNISTGPSCIPWPHRWPFRSWRCSWEACWPGWWSGRTCPSERPSRSSR